MAFREEAYLEYARKNPQKYPGPHEPFEDFFAFNSLTYSVRRRFIELLLPITNHFFRKTSKKNYQQCLDLRGIEVENLSWGDHPAFHRGLLLDNRKVKIDLNRVRTGWAKWFVVTGIVYTMYGVQVAVPDIEQLNFVKKYKRLYFCGGYAEQLECLIHPGLEIVDIAGYFFDFDKFLHCLDKLNVCQRLESISISTTNVISAAVFLELKQYLEQLAGRHPDAQIGCELGDTKYFRIHEHVLCHTPEPGVFVKDYNFEGLPQ